MPNMRGHFRKGYLAFCSRFVEKSEDHPGSMFAEEREVGAVFVGSRTEGEWFTGQDAIRGRGFVFHPFEMSLRPSGRLFEINNDLGLYYRNSRRSCVIR